MNLLIDSRDLIELLERGKPATADEVEAFLRSHDDEFVLSLTNVRELVSTLAVVRTYLPCSTWNIVRTTMGNPVSGSRGRRGHALKRNGAGRRRTGPDERLILLRKT
jgi:hypothetical protein